MIIPPSRETQRNSTPLAQRFSLDTQYLLQGWQTELNSFSNAELIWREVFNSKNRELLGGSLTDALQKHKSSLGMASFAWQCEPKEALVRLLEAFGTLPAPRQQWLRRELGLANVQPSKMSPVVPVWRRDLGELWFCGQLARRIKSRTRAHAIVPILDAFEDQGWPVRIVGPGGNQTLNQRVKLLNVNLFGIRFLMDGTGEGVRWGLYDRPAPSTYAQPF